MQPDLELKFPEQSINVQQVFWQKLRFLDLGTEIHAPEQASRTRPPQNQKVREPPFQYIKYPSPVISNFIG